MSVKSNEFDIRAAVIRQLLSEGLERKQIRIEIPFDTASFTGRGDIIVLTDKIMGIELKSGKDTFCPAALKEQCKQYHRTFDAVGTVIDLSHKREWEEKRDWGICKLNNWADVDIQYSHPERQLLDYYSKPISSFFSNYEYRFKSSYTCVYDMACLLWASEAKTISGLATKRAYCNWVRENGCLKDLRPKVINHLMNRAFNKWEAKFWEKFDAGGMAA